MRPSCTGILLAAGQGRRFGSNKLLHSLADGTPMAIASSCQLRQAVLHCIAVVDEEQGETAQLLAETGLQVIANPQARDGMGTSIACGVAASPDAAGWIIALADMPHIPVTVIQALADALAHGADIVAPVFRGQRGHPVGFAARHGQALRSLQGDHGARTIIELHRDTLMLIDTEDRGVINDIDTPAAL